MARIKTIEGFTIIEDIYVASVAELAADAVDFGVDLSGADLRAIDFRDANLSRGIFKGALFSNSDLRGADLSFADVRGATFLGAKINTTTRLKDILYFGSEFEGADVEKNFLGATHD